MKRKANHDDHDDQSISAVSISLQRTQEESREEENLLKKKEKKRQSMGEDRISAAWCCGLAGWECTPYEAAGIWSVILFYLSVLVVSGVHLAMLNGHVAETSSLSDGESSEYLFIALPIYFFTFVIGCLLWVLNPRWAHPLQVGEVQLLGAIFMVICTLVFLKAHVDMGDTWYPMPNAPPRLVTRGVFRFARHPLYAIFIWATIGTLLATLNWVIAFCVSGLVMVTLGRIKTEERMLVRLFGERYVEYQRRVPALGFPWRCLGFDGKALEPHQRQGESSLQGVSSLRQTGGESFVRT